MSFSYNPDLDTALDRVRFALGDVSQAGALLADEEIGYYLDTVGLSEDATVGTLASALLVRYGRSPKSVRWADGTTLDFSASIDVWKRLEAKFYPGAGGYRISKPARPQDLAGPEYSS